jgi:hypothetical protein
MPSWKKIIVSGSDAALKSLVVTNGVTGSLFGTASWATSASWAPNTPTSIYNGNLNINYSNLSTLYVSGSGVTMSNPSSGIVSMSIGGGASPSGDTTAVEAQLWFLI